MNQTDETKRRHASRHLRQVRKSIVLLEWLGQTGQAHVHPDLHQARAVETRLALIVGR